MVVDINMHSDTKRAKPCHVNVHPGTTYTMALLLSFFVSSIFPVDPPSSPTSCQTRMHLSTPRTQSCLKSHLHLHSVLPFLCLSDFLICQLCSSLPAAAAARATDSFIVLLFLALTLLHPATSHLPPARDAEPWDLSCGAFIQPSPRLLEPLIPSCLHPVTEEWPGQRAGAEQLHRASVVKQCVLCRARGNQCR